MRVYFHEACPARSFSVFHDCDRSADYAKEGKVHNKKQKQRQTHTYFPFHALHFLFVFPCASEDLKHCRTAWHVGTALFCQNGALNEWTRYCVALLRHPTPQAIEGQSTCLLPKENRLKFMRAFLAYIFQAFLYFPNKSENRNRQRASYGLQQRLEFAQGSFQTPGN